MEIVRLGWTAVYPRFVCAGVTILSRVIALIWKHYSKSEALLLLHPLKEPESTIWNTKSARNLTERTIIKKAQKHCMFLHLLLGRKSWRNISSPSDISELFHEHTGICIRDISEKTSPLYYSSWRLLRSTSNFSEFPHSVIYVWWKIPRSGRLSAD